MCYGIGTIGTKNVLNMSYEMALHKKRNHFNEIWKLEILNLLTQMLNPIYNNNLINIISYHDVGSYNLGLVRARFDWLTLRRRLSNRNCSCAIKIGFIGWDRLI